MPDNITVGNQPMPMQPGGGSQANPAELDEFLNSVIESMGEEVVDRQLGATRRDGGSRLLKRDQILEAAKYGTVQFFQTLAQEGRLDFPPNNPVLPVPNEQGNPPPGGTKGNVFLSNPNMGGAVTFYFMMMMATMKYSRTIELEFKLEAMDWIGHLAKESAEMVLRSSELEAQRLELQAMSAMVQGTVQIGIALGTAVAIPFKNDHFMNNVNAGTPGMFSQGIVHYVEGFTKFFEAGIVKEKGEVDAWKEVISGLQRIADQMMQSAFQADQELQELLKKALDMIRSIWEQQFQTMGRIFT